MNTIFLRPGTPDDANREYLPERIRGSDIVVNENGNNSQPYPERLREFRAPLTPDGRADVWYEYVPESYVPGRKVPLVVSLHGGLMTGWGQAIYTSWTLMAERHGFIAVFPDASNDRVWCVEWGKWRFDGSGAAPEAETPPPGVRRAPANPAENRDVQLIMGLIARMKQKYSIDEERIYLQGMSMGNLMTSLFARYFSGMLAGAAGSGCATFTDLLFTPDGALRQAGGCLPVWQSRPENNDIPKDAADAAYVNKYNRYYWMKRNGCAKLPAIRIEGEDNLAFYRGTGADLVYCDIKNRDHGQTLDDAALVWNVLFSGCRRKADGSIVRDERAPARTGDAYAFAAAEGCAYAWFRNRIVPLSVPAVKWQKLKYHGLGGGQKVRGEYLCVPLRFLAEVCGAQYLPAADTLTARLILPDGRQLQFARGSIGCLIDGDLRSMYCEALHRGGELLVSSEWFSCSLLGLQASACGGVMYVTDHFAALSAGMAQLLRDLLQSGGALPDYDLLKESEAF